MPQDATLPTTHGRPSNAVRLAGPLELAIDLIAWIAAATSALYLRFELHPAHVNIVALLKFIPLTLIVQAAVGLAVGLYRRRWQYGSFEEIRALVTTVAATTLILVAINVWYLGIPRNFPNSSVVFGGVVGLVLMASARYLSRLWRERAARPTGNQLERVLVFGAGAAGLRIVTTMLTSRAGEYLPVGFLDDDPHKRRLSLRGVPVLGNRTELAPAAEKSQATMLLIAVEFASSGLVQGLRDAATALGLQVKVLPRVDEVLGHEPDLGDIRDVNEVDLLGRHQISTDLEAIAGYLAGRRVLVTGAGGSIGSELCRQIAKFSPASLMMLDRDESALHGVQLSIAGHALLDSDNLILADIRDQARVRAIFEERKPEVVFHAAALKHLPLLEQYPAEAFKSNVVGTQTLLDAANAYGVDRFVNISTDKAANPTSVLGYSKRLAERLTTDMARQSAGVYLSVRFGNVLGSRGSVLTSFRSQIERGGPVTVTDRDVTRYFMTIPEAVQLVIQAGAIGRRGEVLVLDMGEPVRIGAVAEQLIEASGRAIEIVYTGLRPGEKLHEELLGDGEVDERPIHPLISHAQVPPLAPEYLQEAWDFDDLEMASWMAQRCAVRPPASKL